MSENVWVKHDENEKKFFIEIDGQYATLTYQLSDNEKTIDYRSTYVPPELRGKKIGETLAKTGLNYAKDNKLKVIPTCSFIRTYMDRHPEYQSILKSQS